MTSGYILIVAILVLGGVLATLGDRVGTRVGKARLSLFNLRPRKTATVVTIITGSLISASTLGILLGTSSSLRQGIFELDSIKRKLRIARDDIRTINTQKSQVESELAKTRADQAAAQKLLDTTNRNFQQAQRQLKKISKQATFLRSEIKLLLAERQQLLRQRDELNNQITLLKARVIQQDQELIERSQTIEQRNRELAEKGRTIEQRNRELAQKNQTINERNQQLAQQDQVIAERETRLKELEQQFKEAIAQRETRLQELAQQLAQREKQLEAGEKQLAYLEREVETLEQYFQNYQVLRQGNVVLVRGQVLAFGVVRIVEPSAAVQAVEQLLREANRKTIEITHSSNGNSDEALVKISNTQVDQLVNQIKDGKDYVVRIVSANNYVEGEKQVEVFADAALNQTIFQAGDILAAVSADPSTMTNEQMRQRLEQLLAAAQFRARRAGVLGTVQVGDGRISTIVSFIEQLNQFDQPLDVKAVAQETTFTSGPLKMQLVATQKGQVVFKT
jgi:uncharacterized protein (DUF3084 family)